VAGLLNQLTLRDPRNQLTLHDPRNQRQCGVLNRLRGSTVT